MQHRYSVGDRVRVVAPIYPDVPVGTLADVLDVASDGGVVVRVAGIEDCLHFCARDVRIHARSPK